MTGVGPTGDGRRGRARNLVTRVDGKLVNVARKIGQILVCANGCCCGHVERGHARVPGELYHNEWERRKLRNTVHLTLGGCLGPCPLSNVVLVLFDGRAIWFHSFNTEEQVLALYDYVEQMVAAQSYLPPPPALAPYQFTAFDWEPRPGETRETLVRGPAPLPVARSGFLFLTQADTDLLALSKVVPRLDPQVPPVRAHNVSHLASDDDVDAFLNTVLPGAEVVIVRLLGGRASFARGLDQIAAHAREHDQWLICLPGTDALDPELTAASNVGVPVVHEALAYLQLGGLKNLEHLLRFLSDHLLMTGVGYDPPEPQPRHGVYHPDVPEGTLDAWRRRADPARPTIGVLFYRSHMLSGNTDFVDALVRAGEARGANVLPVYAYSLKEPDPTSGARLPAALTYFVNGERAAVDVLVATTSFALAGGEDPAAAEVLRRLDVPIVQAITASADRAAWERSQRGLGPLDTAMNVAIPEFDGRIVGPAISFKEAQGGGLLGSPAVRYAPVDDRVERVIGQALRLAALRRTPNREKRIAFVLTNYTARASRVANAVGLDTPASLVRLLEAMREAGYDVRDLPPDGDALLQALIARASYDEEVVTEEHLATAVARIAPERMKSWVAGLPDARRHEVVERWGAPPGRHYVDERGDLALAGIELGSAFVAIQPPRGYGMDPSAIYHTPDLPPPHPYHALYRWLGTPVEDGGWGADAIVHLGKHGTLEWLPGKAVGVSAECYPDLFLGDLPLVYPFIVNNPGEGAQAKRRTHAVIVDHLTPPMTTAEGYGEIEELQRLVDEYFQLEQLDPSKLPLLQQQIWELIQRARLDVDLAQLMNRDNSGDVHPWDPTFHADGVPYTISDMSGKDFAHLVENMNGYLCELTSAQIRDGLHVLGQPPTGAQLVDTVLALVRVPNLDVPSLRAGVAEALGFDLDAVLGDLAGRPRLVFGHPLPGGEEAFRTNADALGAIDRLARRLVEQLAERDFEPGAVPNVAAGFPSDVARTLRFVCEELVPNLRRCTAEVDNVLHALDGGYVPPGPSGAPTRGMAHVLPTGRNFYSVDPRALPSLAAWRVGEELADALLRRHLADEGRYPESVGISIWGTSAMRTHGDDVAEVFALLGVRPRWQAESRRVVGIEVIPLEELGRPRIDVVCRISGFFRDAFPHLIALLDEAFRTVAALDEPPARNFVRAHQAAERERLAAGGLPPEEAAAVAGYRIFGCKPGTYGAGILPLIDERNWRDAADFAEAYVNWGGYAYTASAYGVDARPAFRRALEGVQVALKNQDNREHDIFDSDDYLQYHGGMIATIRALTGRNPRRYFGDSADPQRPRVRDLKEEALRVFRTRVVNPKWLASIQRHGYKGALEMAATVDYLFGYDATANVVDDWMYARVAEAYALDPAVRAFMRRSNPWALRDISARLLEAIDRSMWAEPGALADALRRAYLEAEGDLEGRAEAAPAGARP